MGHLTKISYKSASENGTPYTKGTGAAFPVIDFQAPITIVSSVLTDNGRGSQNTMNYAYNGIKIPYAGQRISMYDKTDCYRCC